MRTIDTMFKSVLAQRYGATPTYLYVYIYLIDNTFQIIRNIAYQALTPLPPTPVLEIIRKYPVYMPRKLCSNRFVAPMRAMSARMIIK